MTERKNPDMWVEPEDDPREFFSGVPADEKDNLVRYLRVYRLTVQMKCDGLDAEQLARRSVEPSTMSLLGLIRHMADVERVWFRRRLAGNDVPPIYWADDAADVDWEGAVADDAVVADAWRAWREECAFADEFIEANEMDLVVQTERGPLAVRDVVVHMIEEYARHAGHADLLRERIDGRTGQ
jgi:uncharacterized damage-inducible protein DinB